MQPVYQVIWRVFDEFRRREAALNAPDHVFGVDDVVCIVVWLFLVLGTFCLIITAWARYDDKKKKEREIREKKKNWATQAVLISDNIFLADGPKETLGNECLYVAGKLRERFEESQDTQLMDLIERVYQVGIAVTENPVTTSDAESPLLQKELF